MTPKSWRSYTFSIAVSTNGDGLGAGLALYHDDGLEAHTRIRDDQTPLTDRECSASMWSVTIY